MAVKLAVVALALLVSGCSPPPSPYRPFRVVLRQWGPGVVLFRHVPTGLCFMGYRNGGLVAVDKAVCDDAEARGKP